MIGTKYLMAGVAIIGLLLCGCDQSQRRLSGGYSLKRFDAGGTSYYVTASGEAINGGGIFDGTVQDIGWNQDWILARITRLYQGDSNGWYVLDLKTSRIAGPFPDADLKTNLAFSSIKTVRPAEVFAGK